MILKVGRWRKRSTVLMTPFFSNRVCQAMVLSRKFIHIGRMKIQDDELALVSVLICLKSWPEDRT